MNKRMMLTALLVTTTGIISANSNASNYWRDKVAEERGYSDHYSYDKAMEEAREQERYHQQQEDDRRRQEDADRERERYRAPWGDE